MISSKVRGTIFPQQKIARNFSNEYSVLRKSMDHHDAEIFFMLADATCSTLPKVDIEKIHVDVFKNKKIMTPSITKNDLETLEILNDPELMKELKESRKEAKKGRYVLWKNAKILRKKTS